MDEKSPTADLLDRYVAAVEEQERSTALLARARSRQHAAIEKRLLLEDRVAELLDRCGARTVRHGFLHYLHRETAADGGALVNLIKVVDSSELRPAEDEIDEAAAHAALVDARSGDAGGPNAHIFDPLARGHTFEDDGGDVPADPKLASLARRLDTHRGAFGEPETCLIGDGGAGPEDDPARLAASASGASAAPVQHLESIYGVRRDPDAAPVGSDPEPAA